ncbi:hypothetical protein Tco_0921671 [Tanacetum coccineum]
MNELNELRDQAYENSLIYKEKTKKIHDSKIKNRVFNIVLWGNRLSIQTSIPPSSSLPLSSSMFDARHELCFLKFVSDVNAISKPKSIKKAKKKEEWKPTRKMFTKIGYNWRPTGRTFTLVGNAFPLSRITATNKVPLKEPIPLEIAKSMISNQTEPNTSPGSNTLVAPSSSSFVDLRLSKLFYGIWTPDAQST